MWGLQVARILYRKNETTFWQHLPKDAPGTTHLFGELAGLEQIKPRKIFDITPYTVAKAETFKADVTNPFRAKGRLSGINGGIDAKIGVTNNMTMDLTINPDFGQVEADPSEVNLSAYETFFSEQRPFFIEGNNITNFGIGIGDGGVGNDNLFYSRRIGRKPQGDPDLNDGWNSDVPTQSAILGAAKLTGKNKNGLSLGFVEAVTAEEIAEIDTLGGRIFETVEPLTNYFVGRVQKDINDGNTIIGGIITSTNRKLDTNLAESLHKAAYTGGADFTQYFKEKSWMFNINADFYSVWNFGGDNTGKGFEWNANMGLESFWSVWTGGNLSSSSLSTGMLRRGPMMKIPGSANARIRDQYSFASFVNAVLSLENYAFPFNCHLNGYYRIPL